VEELIEIGKKLELLRVQLRLKQIDVAELTGLGVKTVRNIEKGREGTSIKNVIQVANVLGASLKIAIKKMSDENRTIKL
jgi:transcriptional regulator with XRE-family HTH domain